MRCFEKGLSIFPPPSEKLHSVINRPFGSERFTAAYLKSCKASLRTQTMLPLTRRAPGFGLTGWLQNQLVSRLGAGFPHISLLLQSKLRWVDPSLQTCPFGCLHLFCILNPDKRRFPHLASLEMLRASRWNCPHQLAAWQSKVLCG